MYVYSLNGLTLTTSMAVVCIFSIPLVASHVKKPESCTSKWLMRSRDPMPFLCRDGNRFTVKWGLDFLLLLPPPPSPFAPPTGASFMYHWMRNGGGSPVTSQFSFTDLPESLVTLFNCRTKCITPVNRNTITTNRHTCTV